MASGDMVFAAILAFQRMPGGETGLTPSAIFLALLVVLAFFVGLWLFSKNYLKVPPNTVAVVSGRKRKLPDGSVVGYRLVAGGATFRFPVLEKVDYLSLNVFTIPLEIKRAYTLKGVPVFVKAVANVKIRGDDVSLRAAAERFLGMNHDQIQRVIFQTLEGHLRSILGTLTVEEINNDRQSFAQKLTTETLPLQFEFPSAVPQFP
jgi:flotillin